MLIISLFLSAILLLLVNRANRRSRYRTWTILKWTLGFGVCPIFFMAFFPPLALQACLLVGVLVVCGFTQRGPSLFLPLSCAVTVLPYTILGFLAYQEYAELREAFPYESMEERLRLPSAAARPLPGITTQRLANLGEALNESSRMWTRKRRLQKLHEETVQVFIDSPGFGVARLVLYPSRATLTSGRIEEPPVPQPGAPLPLVLSLGEEVKEAPPSEQGGLYRMHDDGVLDFVNPGGFGFIKDRRHVAGFQPHQFSWLPEPAPRWRVQHLDLVGLLRHETPVVYVSDHLPRMDELREAPTRSLDVFELAGLASLQRGADFFVRDTSDGLRMLGAIRSVQQCVECHGGKPGDLLGGFSYSLRRGQR